MEEMERKAITEGNEGAGWNETEVQWSIGADFRKSQWVHDPI